jgi:hypothetical protein
LHKFPCADRGASRRRQLFSDPFEQSLTAVTFQREFERVTPYDTFDRVFMKDDIP